MHVANNYTCYCQFYRLVPMLFTPVQQFHPTCLCTFYTFSTLYLFKFFEKNLWSIIIRYMLCFAVIAAILCMHSINLMVGAWQEGQITWIADLWLVECHTIILIDLAASLIYVTSIDLAAPLIYVTSIVYVCIPAFPSSWRAYTIASSNTLFDLILHMISKRTYMELLSKIRGSYKYPDNYYSLQITSICVKLAHCQTMCTS